jgi:hypothetical protein
VCPQRTAESIRKNTEASLKEYAEGQDIHEVFSQWIREEDAVRFQVVDETTAERGLIRRSWRLDNVEFERDLIHVQAFLNIYGSIKNKSPQTYVDSPMVDGMVKDGRWRCVNVDLRSSGTDKWLVQELREGFIRNELNWEEAHIEELPQAIVKTNSETVGPYDSENPKSAYAVRWRGVDPFKAQELASGLNASTYENPKVRGVELSGTWFNLGSVIIEENDGSCTIEIVLGKTRLVFESFENYNTSRAGTIYYLFDVPLSQVQTIIDYWKSGVGKEGYSGRVTGAGERTANLVLSKSDNLETNLIASGIRASCDTTIQMDFAWGYTESNIITWLEAFNTADAGVSREISGPTIRGDGMYDAVVITTTTTYDSDKHEFEIALAVGDNITRTITAGWNLALSDLNGVKSTYTTGSQGSTSQFQVTRKGNCTFDYIGVLAVESGKENSSTKGDVTVYDGRGVTAITPTVDTDSDVIRSFSIQTNEDDTFNYRMLVGTLYSDTKTANDTVTYGKTYVQEGHNVDKGDIPLFTGAKLVLSRIVPGENDKYNYFFVSRDLDEVAIGVDGSLVDEENAPVVGDSSQNITLKEGLLSDSLPTIPTIEQGKTVRLNFTPTAEGKIRWSLSEADAQELKEPADGDNDAQTSTTTRRVKTSGDVDVQLRLVRNADSVPSYEQEDLGSNVEKRCDVRSHNSDNTFDYWEYTTTQRNPWTPGVARKMQWVKGRQREKVVFKSNVPPFSSTVYLYSYYQERTFEMYVERTYYETEEDADNAMSEPSMPVTGNNTRNGKVKGRDNLIWYVDVQHLEYGDWDMTSAKKESVTATL